MKNCRKMDTCSNLTNKEEDCHTRGHSNLSEVFAEHLPRLSILNLYLKFQTEVKDNVAISVHKNCSAISIQPFDFNIRFDGILFENEGEVKPSMNCKSVLTFRLVTRPIESGLGSSQVEFMSSSGIPHNLFEDEGLNKMRKYFLHSPQEIVSEGVLLNVNCRNCQNILGSNIIFSKVRALPAGNWDEKANDFWYCHPPGGSCGHSDNSSALDSVANSLKAVKIADENLQTSNGIFDILNNPDPNTCLFSPCYWAVNKSIIPLCAVDKDREYNQGKKIVCVSCSSEIGMKFSENCYHIWDFGVVWSKPDNIDKINVACVRDRAVDNFKRSIFSHIYELSYSPICQFIVKSCFNPRSSLFMWNSDRDLSAYETGVNYPLSDDLVLPQQKVAKFLFSETNESNGEFNVNSPFEQNLIKDVEKDDSLVLLVPDTVLKFGKLHLQKSSAFYATPASSFQCGYLKF